MFLLLSNPAFTRVAGIRLRSQCETFIAVAVTAAFVLLLGQGKLLARKGTERRSGAMLGAGVLFGLAFAFSTTPPSSRPPASCPSGCAGG